MEDRIAIPCVSHPFHCLGCPVAAFKAATAVAVFGSVFVFTFGGADRSTAPFPADVRVKGGKRKCIGSFHTAHGLRGGGDRCAEHGEKGLQDKRDAALLAECLSTHQGEEAAKREVLTLERNSTDVGFMYVCFSTLISPSTRSALRPFRIQSYVKGGGAGH